MSALSTMQIDMTGTRIGVIGDESPILAAALGALVANGAEVRDQETPDILLVSLPLLPTDAIDVTTLMAAARSAAALMAARGSGRIVCLLSGIGGLPMRRHPAYSAAMAMALADVRGLAMSFGPQVLVNAVGVGAIGEPTVAGDPAMLTHVPLGRPGTIAEVVAAVLFFCDPLNTYSTGQMLSVDGGWSAGYGRDF